PPLPTPMPSEIIGTGPTAFRFREYDLPPLGDQEVRVKVTFAAPKHGTEGHSLAGSPWASKIWDPELRLFIPKKEAPEASPPSERRIGNMVVGTVTAVGAAVQRFAPGEAVFGYGPIREEHQAGEE